MHGGISWSRIHMRSCVNRMASKKDGAMGRTSRSYDSSRMDDSRYRLRTPFAVGVRATTAEMGHCLAVEGSRSGNRAPAGGGPGAFPSSATRTRSRLADAGLRIGGLAMIARGVTSVYWLTTLAYGVPPHEPSVLECLLAAAAFVGSSCGAGLLALGAHIHDPIEISVRWRPLRRSPLRGLPRRKRDQQGASAL